MVTVNELRQEAAKHNIKGRSKMNKAQLCSALAAVGVNYAECTKGAKQTMTGSPRKRKTTPKKSTSPKKSASPKKRKSASPKKRKSSPKKRKSSPKKRKSTPKRKSASPKRKSASPKRKSASPKRKSPSEKEIKARLIEEYKDVKPKYLRGIIKKNELELDNKYYSKDYKMIHEHGRKYTTRNQIIQRLYELEMIKRNPTKYNLVERKNLGSGRGKGGGKGLGLGAKGLGGK